MSRRTGRRHNGVGQEGSLLSQAAIAESIHHIAHAGRDLLPSEREARQVERAARGAGLSVAVLPHRGGWRVEEVRA